MNNIKNLIFINIKSVLSSFGNKTNSHKKNMLNFLFIPLVLYFILIFYFLYSSLYEESIKFDFPQMILLFSFAIASFINVLSNINVINGQIFGSKDYDLLNSLPLSANVIVISKIFVIYLFALIIDAVIMLPALFVYLLNIQLSISFIFIYLLTFLLVPVFPLLLATFIGVAISYVSSFLKHKNLVNIIFSLGFMLLIMYYNFKFTSNSAFTSFAKSITDLFNKIYPLSSLYNKIIIDLNLLSFLLYILIIIILIYCYYLIIKLIYFKINSKLINVKTNNNVKVKYLNNYSIKKTLIIKEAKRYFSSYIYLLNTSFGLILMTIGLIFGLIFGLDKLTKILEISKSISLDLGTYIPLGILVISLMTAISCSSISLEGQSLKILKSLPIKTMDIFLSKVMFNFIVIMVLGLVNIFGLAILIKMSFIQIGLSFLILISSSIFISLYGLLINLKFPLTNYKNEVEVVKQSAASFITIISSLIFAFSASGLIMTINYDKQVMTLILSIILLLLSYIMYFILKIKGVLLFKSLS